MNQKIDPFWKVLAVVCLIFIGIIFASITMSMRTLSGDKVHRVKFDIGVNDTHVHAVVPVELQNGPTAMNEEVSCRLSNGNTFKAKVGALPDSVQDGMSGGPINSSFTQKLIDYIWKPANLDNKNIDIEIRVEDDRFWFQLSELNRQGEIVGWRCGSGKFLRINGKVSVYVCAVEKPVSESWSKQMFIFDTDGRREWARSFDSYLDDFANHATITTGVS